jgi:aldose sugar dehydrogenase
MATSQVHIIDINHRLIKFNPVMKSYRALVGLLSAFLVMPLTSCAQSIPEGNVQSGELTFKVVTVAEGLENPWAIAFLPDGDILVTERPGRIRIIRNGVLLDKEVQGLPTIRTGNQGGLLDLILHPDFANNRLVYISYSKPNADDSEGTTSIIRARFENDALVNVEEILEAKAWYRSRGHYGSRLAFDKDGYLFITIGDRQVPPRGELQEHNSQKLSDHFGTTLRIHDDGRVPQDNPFVGVDGAMPEIWSYGHRNAQGLTIDPATGNIWQHEHGPQGGDELNLTKKGVNYGWPVIGYGVNYGVGTPIHESATKDGMEQPVHYWVPSIAASGLMIYNGDAFPQWKGNIFAGGLAGEQLARLIMDGTRVLSEETLLSGIGRIRDVRQGPDGFIYLALDSRAGAKTPIVRLEPAK